MPTPLRRSVPLLLVLLTWGFLLLAPPASATAPPWPVPRPGVEPVGVWPLVPRPDVVARFDPPDSRWGAGHRGVDLAGRPGQPVRAALGGRIAFVGRLAGRGVVVVGHGATRTTYEPVGSDLAVGDRVRPGTRIGRLEPWGSHCPPGSCLHWGWLRGETYLDPLELVVGGRVRLLPLWRDLGAPAATPAATPGAGGPLTGWRSPLAAWLRRGGAPAGRPVATGPW